MKIIIRVTSDKDGTEHYVNIDNVVYFTQPDGSSSTRLYFTSGEISHLVTRENPEQLLNQIAEEVQKAQRAL